ncbi:MAG: DUF2185 domain-containing protein [Firmicutes bacterium]|nr:DUF2185 domain-containing protein [Bacillota bacterium]
MNKREYVIVSRKAIEEGAIGFMYRTRSPFAMDSGWRMMYDRGEDRLDLANPDKVYTIEIRKLMKYFPEITESILKTKKYCAYERSDGEYKLIPQDKDLDAVPFPMTTKEKYIVLINGHGSAGAPILTADPADMRAGRKIEEWEALLPLEVYERAGGR